MTNQAINPRKLYLVEEPTAGEELVLELASEIHFSRSKHPVVSWGAQEEAASIFNKLGFEGTLDELTRYWARKALQSLKEGE